MHRNRAFFSNSFCGGRGIEIGALHYPFPVPEGSRVRYVDRMTVQDLRKHYPELNDKPLVKVNIVDDGESLHTMPDGQEDFVIAAQFLEHCQNPIRALANMLRVIKNGGFVVLTIPDKRVTFDKQRTITTNEHLMDECVNGTERTKHNHYLESARSDGKLDEAEVVKLAEKWMTQDYSIHFHVWDPDAFIKFLFFSKDNFNLPFEIYVTFMNGEEIIVVLRKMLPGVTGILTVI